MFSTHLLCSVYSTKIHVFCISETHPLSSYAVPVNHQLSSLCVLCVKWRWSWRETEIQTRTVQLKPSWQGTLPACTWLAWTRRLSLCSSAQPACLPACLSARNGTTREEKWQPRPVTLSNLFIGPRMFIADTPFRSSCSITVGIHRSSHAIPNKFAPALVGLFSRFDKQRCFSSSAVEASPSPSSSSYWGLGASTKTHARSLVSTRTRRTWRMWRRGQKKLLHAIWESASPPPVHHHPAAAAQVLHDGGYSVWWP